MKIAQNLAKYASLVLGVAITLSFFSCSKDKVDPKVGFTKSFVKLRTHKLKAYSLSHDSPYLVVFESGLGDDHGVWRANNIPDGISGSADILMYDRAGYGASDVNTEPRGIDRLSNELKQVIDQFAHGRKVVLVGHSLGGMIIRDYAIKYPSKTAALLFVDASHELYNQPTQQEEDMIFNLYKNQFGANFGGTLESRELVEDAEYMSGRPGLPDVPVIALTSMKIDAEHDANDKQLWYDSKEALKTGVSDFTHITTTQSGHYIMLEEPDLVIDNIQFLLSKLP